MREKNFTDLPEARSYFSGQPISKSLELRQDFYQEVIHAYKRRKRNQIAVLIVREDCRFHCLPMSGKFSSLGDTTQELLRLFSSVRSESDIDTFQKGTILDDEMPGVKNFLESRVMFLQHYLYVLMSLPFSDGRYASMKCAIALVLEKSIAYRPYAKILVELHDNCTSDNICH